MWYHKLVGSPSKFEELCSLLVHYECMIRMRKPFGDWMNKYVLDLCWHVKLVLQIRTSYMNMLVRHESAYQMIVTGIQYKNFLKWPKCCYCDTKHVIFMVQNGLKYILLATCSSHCNNECFRYGNVWCGYLFSILIVYYTWNFGSLSFLIDKFNRNSFCSFFNH